MAMGNLVRCGLNSNRPEWHFLSPILDPPRDWYELEPYRVMLTTRIKHIKQLERVYAM